MRSKCKLPLVVLAALAVPALGNGGGWWGDIFERKAVDLQKVIRSPQELRGREVCFVLQFRELGAIENPYSSRFDRETHLNFSGWSLDAALWEKEAYDDAFPYLFARKGTKVARELGEARLYDRFEVTGRVEGIFGGKPWIEVRRIKRMEGALDEPALIRLVKAFRLKRLHRFDAAAAEFAQVADGRYPRDVQSLVVREQGLCLASANRFDEALVPLEKALGQARDDSELARLLAYCRDKARTMPAVAPENHPLLQKGEKPAVSIDEAEREAPEAVKDR